MDPTSQMYKVKFQNNQGEQGFRYFFKESSVLDFLKSANLTKSNIQLEQYDRKTNSFQLIK